jgi:predicted Zn finger-like uncharacterized protein
MIITCPSCSSRYKFDEAKLGERPRAKTRCSKCGASIEIENPLIGAMTLPPGAMDAPAMPPPAPAPSPVMDEKITTKRNLVQAGEATSTGRDLYQAGTIEMPRDKRYSLAVLQGPATGQIFPLGKVRTTLGRAGADILLDDPEASRVHAAIEIMGEHAVLRDLGSTNGTFVELDRIEQHVLNNQSEFRIGSHVLMFIVTDVE